MSIESLEFVRHRSDQFEREHRESLEDYEEPYEPRHDHFEEDVEKPDEETEAA